MKIIYPSITKPELALALQTFDDEGREIKVKVGRYRRLTTHREIAGAIAALKGICDVG